MNALIVIFIIVPLVGGFVSAYYKDQRMTFEEREAHNKKVAEHTKGVISGIAVGSAMTVVYVVKKSGKKRK